MRELIKNKCIGYYFTIIALIAAVAAMVRFLLWAPGHGAMDAVIVAALVLGILFDVLLFFKDNAFFVILSTASYSVAGVKLLTNSVGSFVDAFQGINMFGDATQVPTIVSISIVMAASILLSIVAAFLKRVKEEQ